MPEWIVWSLLAATFAALTAILAKIGIAGVNPDFATLLRTVVILAVLAAIVPLMGKWQPLGSVPARSWLFIALSGLATGASWLFYFRALKVGEASKVAPLDKLSVVLVAIFAAVFLGERLAAINWLGVALITVGVVLVAWRP